MKTPPSMGGVVVAMRFVLFDLVGTLLDERSDHVALDHAMRAVVRRFRLRVRPRVLSGRFALAFMELVRAEPDDEAPTPFVPFREAAPDVLAGILQVEGVAVGAADRAWFWATYLEAQRRAWRPYREVRRVLGRLGGAGFRLGVVTDADRYMLDDILPRLDLGAPMEVAVAAEEAGHVKPHPRLFEMALERAGVAPADAVMVGDSYERDIVGARAAGIANGILVDRHDARTVEVPRVADLKPLPGLLDGWVRGRARLV